MYACYRLWREDVALRRYLLECKSALAVQRVLRGMWGRREAAEKRRVESRACVRIQSVHRGNAARAASAPAVFVKALNKVDLPTFGKPTMPQLNPMFLLLRDAL